LVLVPLWAGACSSDDEGEASSSTNDAQDVSLDEFFSEYFDPMACEGFAGCGDAVEGRFRFESFAICSSPDEFAEFSQLESGLDELCSRGVDVSIDMDVDLELEVAGGACSGGGEVTAAVRLDISAACIAEAGGPPIGQACPELEQELSSVPEFSEGGCTIQGDACSCTATLGVVASGRCSDFVLDSACLDGDTLTVSNLAVEAQPAIWTFERVSGGSNSRSAALPVERVGAAEGAERLTAEVLQTLPRVAARWRR
jgi:hypothetical protein